MILFQIWFQKAYKITARISRTSWMNINLYIHFYTINLIYSQGSQLINSKIKPPSDKTGQEAPIISFIKLEQYNAIKLVQSIHQSLASLSKIIRGTMLLTKEVQNLAAALLNQEVRTICVLVYVWIYLPLIVLNCYHLNRQ